MEIESENVVFSFIDVYPWMYLSIGTTEKNQIMITFMHSSLTRNSLELGVRVPYGTFKTTYDACGIFPCLYHAPLRARKGFVHQKCGTCTGPVRYKNHWKWQLAEFYDLFHHKNKCAGISRIKGGVGRRNHDNRTGLNWYGLLTRP